MAASIVGDSGDSADSRTTAAVLTVNPPRINVLFSLYAVTGAPGQAITLRTLVYSGGAPAVGLLVQFAVDGVTAGSAASTAAGASRAWTIPGDMAAGTHNVTVSFAGDAAHNAATRTSACLSVVVPKANVAFSLYGSSGSAGQVVTLKTLVYSGGTPVSGLTVQFAVDGVVCGSVVSTASGASLSYTIPLAATPGAHNVTVSFAGDATHNAATRTSAVLTVK